MTYKNGKMWHIYVYSFLTLESDNRNRIATYIVLYHILKVFPERKMFCAFSLCSMHKYTFNSINILLEKYEKLQTHVLCMTK